MTTGHSILANIEHSSDSLLQMSSHTCAAVYWRLLLVHFCHAPLGVRSAKHRHQSPEWMILSQVNCFIQGEVIGFQVLLDSLHPRSMRLSWWSPVLPKGKLLWSSWWTMASHSPWWTEGKWGVTKYSRDTTSWTGMLCQMCTGMQIQRMLETCRQNSATVCWR